jgi:hypothetical protein
VSTRLEDLAEDIAKAVMKNLRGRKAVLDEVEPEIQDEMESEIKDLIHHKLDEGLK